MPLFEVEPVAWEVPDPQRLRRVAADQRQCRAARRGGARAVARAAGLCGRRGDRRGGARGGLRGRGDGDGGVERLLGSIPAGPAPAPSLRRTPRPTARAPAITAVPVYRSVALPPPEDLRDVEGQVVAVHSPRAAGGWPSWSTRPGSIAPRSASPRSAKPRPPAAGDGWASGRGRRRRPTTTALLALAARLCDKPRDDMNAPVPQAA